MSAEVREDGLPWRFVQSFGDDNSSDDDLVTAVEFDHQGDYLAVGDKAGRICLFEAHRPDSKSRSTCEYKFYTEFQSHEPEFDCLKSLEIEEKINMIKWAKSNNGLFLLATNDKTIKLWKVHDKKIKRPTKIRTQKDYSTSISNSALRIPKLSHWQTLTTATNKRVFSNAHGYHINSISINCDGQTFLSADDLRINLWHLDNNTESFTVVDIKPPNLEELTEVITAATFSHDQCNLLIYGSSRGSIRLADMRNSALCDQHTKVFAADEDATQKNFFSEITNSVSDVKFTQDGRYILSRDFLSLKVWDVNMESSPVATIPVHDYLMDHLSDLYENDCIFDKFECSINSAGNRFITGSYDNNFMLHNVASHQTARVEALKGSQRRRPVMRGKSNSSTMPDVPVIKDMDFGKRALHVAWHPLANTVAVAGLNKLYIYDAAVPSSTTLD